MKRLLLSLIVLFLFPCVAWAEGELVTIRTDTILLKEPDFTLFVKNKMPQLYEKADRLSNTRDLLHLDVDYSTFEELFFQIEDFYTLSSDLAANIEEYTKEAASIREKVLQEQELTSPEAIRRILDFKFVEKNIRYARESILEIDKELNILLTLLKGKTLKVPAPELEKKGLRGFSALLVNELEELKKNNSSYKNFSKQSRKGLKTAGRTPEAKDLAKRFDQLATDISGKVKLGQTTRSSFSRFTAWIGDILGYELYILDNKKVTPVNFLTVLFGVFILIGIYRAIRFSLRFRDVEPGKRYVIRVLARYIIFIAMVPVVLYGIGLDITKITLLVSALSVGIGFGLQKIFSNLISGIILLLDRSIKRGDTVEVEDVYGVVTSMRARNVFVRTRDGKEYLIPNESLLVNKVINWTHSDSKLRLKIPVGVSYDCDVELARKLCLEVADGIERLLKKPEPNCLLRGFGDNSVDLELRVWIRDPQRGIRNVTSEVLLGIWHIFKENNIEIPYPQRDLHFKTVTEEVSAHFLPEK